MKRQLLKWERLCANHISDKRLLSRLYKQLSWLNNNKKTGDYKMAKGLKTDISPKKTHRWPGSTWKDAQHHPSLVRCKSKTQDTTSHPLGWLPSTKQKTKTMCWRGCGGITSGNVKWDSCCGKWWWFLRKWNRTAMWFSSITSGYVPKISKSRDSNRRFAYFRS